MNPVLSSLLSQVRIHLYQHVGETFYILSKQNCVSVVLDLDSHGCMFIVTHTK